MQLADFNPVEMARRWRQLEKVGVLGLNARNGDYISRYNPRRLYPRVDNKILSKRLLQAAGMPVPELYGVVSTQHEAAHAGELLKRHGKFALKPANGSGGDGILVIVDHKEGAYRKADGTWISAGDMAHHVSSILSGLFSLGGHSDEAMVEALVQFDPAFENLAWQGVPDVRIIVYCGYPVMAMTRLPTRASGGRANLHQGAVGVGIDIATGRTVRGTWSGQVIDAHPDTGAPMPGFAIPEWDVILDIAARCYETIGLGYMGVDVVLDRNVGPMILELNARPGLAIQIANQAGLRSRLRCIEGGAVGSEGPHERVERARRLFRREGPATPA